MKNHRNFTPNLHSLFFCFPRGEEYNTDEMICDDQIELVEEIPDLSPEQERAIELIKQGFFLVHFLVFPSFFFLF